MSLEQENILIEFHRDSVLDILITDTIRYMGYNLPQKDESLVDGKVVSENWGIIVETPCLQVDFEEETQLAVRVLENSQEMDCMLVEIMGVEECGEHVFVDQLAYVKKVDIKIVAHIPDLG